MMTVLVSVAAGGVIIGLLVGGAGLLAVRTVTRRPTQDLAMHRQSSFVKSAEREQWDQDRREAA